LCFAGGVIAGFSPQGLMWLLSYGSFFFMPNKFNFGLSNFDIIDVLFSSYHGILFWTPVMIPALIGLVYWQKKGTSCTPEYFWCL